MMMWALSSILKCTIMPRSSSNSSHGLLWLLVISIVVAVRPVSIQSVSNLITNSGEQIMFFSKLIILHIKTKFTDYASRHLHEGCQKRSSHVGSL